VCGAELSLRVHRQVRDFEHGLPVAADFDACASCGLLAQVPPPTAAALAAYYPTDYRPHVTAGLVARLKGIQASRQAAKLARHLPAKSEPILELGCGAGQFLHALRRRGYTDLTGIDRVPELGRGFAGTDIRYRALDLDQTLDLGGPYAAIVMNYVIEHFVSPEAVLGACRAALRPGGRVILLTPNTASLSHQWFGRYWSGLHAPRHTQLFSPKNLRLLADKLGFAGVELVSVTDPASWTLSFQNLVQARRGAAPRAGTAWYSLALLPAWMPFALVERALGRGSSMYAVLG